MRAFSLLRAVVPVSVLLVCAAACGGANGVTFTMEELPDAATPLPPPVPPSGDGGGGGMDASSTVDTGSAEDTGSTGDTGTADAVACTDNDKDGQTTCAGDCDDNDALTFQGSVEICGDAKDNNCDTKIDEACGGIGTFVSGTGLDTNPGTKTSPVKTITKGIANAVAIGGAQTVFVAEGHYPEKVTLIERISLLGGHHCDATACTWAQDRKVYDTAIDMQDFEGVVAGSAITKKTRVEGFRLRGKAGAPTASPGGACITLSGGTPTIMSNTIVGGDVNGGNPARSVGIAIVGTSVDQTGALIDGNTVNGGGSTGTSTGIAMDGPQGGALPPVAVITNNTIRGGAAPNTSGIIVNTSGAATIVRRNDVLAGTATGGSGNGWGIVVSSKATIDANRVNADQANVGTCQGSNWCGGIVSYSSTSTITNNIAYGVKGPRTTGILLTEAEVPAGAVSVNGNYFDGAGSGLSSLSGVSSGMVFRIGGCGTCGTNTIIGKVRNNILMGGSNVFRYGAYEDQITSKTAHPQVFDNNDIFFSMNMNQTDVLYHLWNGTLPTDLGTTAQITSTVPTNPAPANNINSNPQLDATMHIAGGSPCKDNGTMTEAPPKDFEGDSRPQGGGIDIGHDER